MDGSEGIPPPMPGIPPPMGIPPPIGMLIGIAGIPEGVGGRPIWL
ncbi:Uncharacterised protein [Mycobacteroides abscessus subsp. massiliense]|nr:Uncharacterised protein [Mycobacteroides abscessus subsp. massiliense]SKF54934.1 Uncharacterised protein [Mycobacteroides abscessus subsp. massiliense]SKH67746.1 Uncharacterised protein [Mycobacteroides abscessus subsp. massiliense]SKH79231.1 Uncharacterised protein [Mycobacteroides abscessus subsp. massiliense]